MSRHGYSDHGDDNLAFGRWRRAVDMSLNGKRGQAFLKELLAALDALPEKKLIAQELVEADGAVCALGAVAVARKLDVSGIDPEDYDYIHVPFGIANAMAREIIYINDEVDGEHVEAYGPHRFGPHRKVCAHIPVTPEKRFAKVRAWVVSHIRNDVP